jgi:hypothetical protein
LAAVRSEIDRAKQLIDGLKPGPTLELITSGDDGRGSYGTSNALTAFLKALNPHAEITAPAGTVQVTTPLPNLAERHARQVHELDRHNQWLLRESQYVRKTQFWDKLNYESLAKYSASIEPLSAVSSSNDYRPMFAHARSTRITNGPAMKL